MSGSVIITSGIQTGLTVGLGNSLIVEAGATVVDTIVMAGGNLILVGGGTASGTLIEPGGTVLVTSGGVLSDTTVQSAAVANIVAGGTDITTQVSSGGTLLANGAVNTDITADDGAVVLQNFVLSSGDVASGLIISAGEQLTVQSGATILAADVQSGGYVNVLSGGEILSSLIEAGGSAAISGGTADTTNIQGGVLDVENGLAISTNVASGGILFLSNSVQSDTTTADGGFVIVNSGITGAQITSGATVFTSETLYVSSGGEIVDTLVQSGGVVIVSSGGVETTTTIAAGGYDEVYGSSYNDSVAGSLSIDAPGGYVQGATVVGGGSIRVNATDTASNLTIGGSGVVTNYGTLAGTITFADQGQLIDDGSAIAATLANFNSVGESLDLTQLVYSSGAFVSVQSGLLVIGEGGSYTTIAVTGSYTGVSYSVTGDSVAGGTLVTVTAAPCFAEGTLIDTEEGPRPVEALRPGMQLRKQDGSYAPLRWVGSRRVDCRRHPTPELVRPVEIAAGAFGPGLPRRPLRLSPDHALWFEGVLIPVKHLVNGRSLRSLAVAEVQYFHLELPEHDVILAEGLPVESYLDTGDRAAFLEAEGAMPLYPVFGHDRPDRHLAAEALACAPLQVTGPIVERARALLAARLEDLQNEDLQNLAPQHAVS